MTITVAQLTSDLRSSRESLFAPLRGLNEEQFRHVPAGESWSIATHLAHLLRTERVFSERAQLALHEDEPRVPSTRVANDDDPALAQHLAVPQIIHGLQATRRSLEDVLAACDDARQQRAVIHERLGRMTIAQLAEKMATHEGEHAADVALLAAQAPVTRPMIIPLAERR
jgi:uncharacterized damage-inducible protein DinB